MTNNFNKDFFAGNRERLCRVLPDHVLFIAGHALVQYSADLHYPFRQNSNFWYLSGLNDPDAILVIDTKNKKTSLLLQKKNDYQTEWDGESAKVDILSASGVDSIESSTILASIVESAQKDGKKIGYLAPSKNRIEPFGFYANPSRELLGAKLRKLVDKDCLVDIRLDIARLRQVKQPIEIEAIKSAIAVTARTLESVKSSLRDYKTEKDIERAITAGFYLNGGDGHSFEPIVASGKNAAVIHYITNAAALQKNELLLLDVGSQVNGYAADISRVWSLGDASDRQKEVYSACLDIQRKGISLLKPGVSLRDVQSELATFSQEVFTAIDCSMKDKLFPHGFSHHMGLDVHDAADYSQPLEPGMVVTMEPGIYLADEGIGVRIEDDILITEKGSENLSKMIPKLL